MFKQITCLRALTVIGLLLFFHFHAIVFAGGPIILRPPFAGMFRMTSFFDHEKPNYANDSQITIYTGDTGINSSASNCIPYCYRGHSGYDYALPENTPVLAMADGVIAELNFSTIYYGNNIIIAHANNYRTLYAHLRSSTPFNNLTVGQVVRAGDLIGWSGNTGQSGGPHLHFGVYRGAFTYLGYNPQSSENNATDPFD